MMQISRRRGRAVWLAVAAFAVAATATALQAGDWRVVDDSDWCDGSSRGVKYCEVREITLPAWDEVVARTVNGSIRVTAWDRDEIHIEARIRVQKLARDDAKETASQVQIEIGEDGIYATGPRSSRSWWGGNGRKWSVDYRIKVPSDSDIAIKTTNGSLTVDDVTGDIVVQTTNGAIKLHDAGGAVKGGTTNGSIFVGLTDDQWRGDGLDLSTTNGSIKIELPKEFSADVDARTVNGSISVDHPIQIQNKSRNRLKGTIGDGGPVLRARTTNGGVSLMRRNA